MSFAWLSPDEEAEALRYLEQCFGIPPDVLSGHRLLRRGDYVYAAGEDLVEFGDTLQSVSVGLRILKVARHGSFKPTTGGVQRVGRFASRRVYDLTDEQLRELLGGHSLPWDGDNGFVILRSEGAPIGVGVARGQRLMSQLPRSVTEHLRVPEIGASV